MIFHFTSTLAWICYGEKFVKLILIRFSQSFLKNLNKKNSREMAANIFWGRTPLSMPPRGGSKNFQGDSPESFRDGIFAEGRRRADGGGSCGILQCTKIRCVGKIA